VRKLQDGCIFQIFRMNFHKKKICLKFGCKRSSILKLIAPYATTIEPKLARCQPCAQTISAMCWEQVRLLYSTIINSQTYWCIKFKFSSKMHNIQGNLVPKLIQGNFGWKNLVLNNLWCITELPITVLNGIKFCSLWRVSVATKRMYLTPKLFIRITSNFQRWWE